MSARMQNIVLSGIIFISTFLVYGNSLKNDFIWDDHALVVQNKYITEVQYLDDIFKQDLFHDIGNSNSYRPFQTLSYMIDYYIWKLNPIGFHITNILFHAGVAILGFLLFRFITGKETISFCIALLYAAHPIHTEAVTYIAGRADPMVAFFMMASILSFLYYRRNARPFFRYISLLFFICALLSKELAVILPVIILFLCIYSGDKDFKSILKNLFPYLIIEAIYGFLRMTIFHFDTGGEQLQVVLPNQSYLILIFLKYIELLIAPNNLHMERAEMHVFISPWTIFALLIIASFTFYIWKKKSRPLLFGLIWFFIFYFPISNIIPINAVMAEHWVYMASFGYLLIFVLLIDSLSRKYPIALLGNWTLVVPVLFLCLIYSKHTFDQNKIWNNEITFFQYTLKHTPISLRANLNLASAHKNAGEIHKAIQIYEELIRLNPRETTSILMLGEIYSKKGNFKKAEMYYKNMTHIKPKDPKTLNIVGAFYAKQEKYEVAKKYFKQALKYDPQNMSAKSNLDQIYKIMGRNYR